MPPSSSVERETLNKQLRKTRLIAWLAVSLAAFSFVLVWIVWPSPIYIVPYEYTGSGIVRYYDGDARLLLHENSQGYMKLLSPLCSTKNPVWVKMATNIRYHWVPYYQWHNGRGPSAGEECYQLDEVKRVGEDAKPPVIH